MASSHIIQRLEDILRFMQPHWEFVNCHMVNYLTERHWDRFIPAALQHEVPNTASVHSCIETVFWQKDGCATAAEEKFPEMTKFLMLCAQCRLETFTEVLTTKEDLCNILQRPGINQKLSIKEFMSEKKRHEVEITAALVDNLVRRYKELNGEREVFIVDAGDGKGYLSSRLALQYSHRVLGIDSNILNTHNALERNRKLQRAWNGLTVRAERKSRGLTTSRNNKTQIGKFSPNRGALAENLENYKTTSHFITSDLNIVELLQSNFTSSQEEREESDFPAICLTGLHTCGNLSPTCLEIFHAQPQCKILCNIGCCYHLLKELFSDNDLFEQNTVSNMRLQAGFPMSKYLKEKRVKLGRNARMLAAQSVERTKDAKNTINLSLFYRALLEILVSDKMSDRVPNVQVGKIRKFESFEEYVELCCKKKHLSTHFSPNRIAAVQIEFADHRHFMELFYLLRMQFAPILESLILLDRLLYLKELGYEHSFLVPIFDAIVSPRHFSLIAFKDAISK